MKRDREKWDARYAQKGELVSREGVFLPDPLVREHRELLTSGAALDLASGHGGNALFVAELGYKVHALDISFAALSALSSEARTRGIDIQCVVADLDYFPLPRSRYDLVLVFYFFAPALMAAIGDALKKNGVLFYATFNRRHTSVKPGFKPEYLVPPGGLARFFAGFDTVIDEPDWGPEENISRLIARKP